MLSIRMALILVIVAGISPRLIADDSKTGIKTSESSALECDDISGRVFRVFTPLRKIRLATAYFVNPDLPDKSEILSAYTLSSFVKEQKTDELWVGLNSGKIRLLLSVGKKQNEFLPVSLRTVTAIDATCKSPSIISRLPSALSKISFENKDAFRASLVKLGAESATELRLVASQEGALGIDATNQFISWDPNEIGKISLAVANP